MLQGLKVKLTSMSVLGSGQRSRMMMMMMMVSVKASVVKYEQISGENM